MSFFPIPKMAFYKKMQIVHVPVLLITVSLPHRIDVTRNDLPWEFMTDRLPTILFFPHQR